MSNLPLLAQSTQPATSQMVSLLVLGVFGALCAWSVTVIFRRRLYTLPPIPEDAQTPSAPMLAIVLGVAFITFIGVIQLCAAALGVTPEIAKTPEGMRKMLMVQPAAHFITAGFVLAMLAGYLPRFLQWTGGGGGQLKKALIGYFLALPWVFLVGALVSLLAEHVDPSAKKQHPIFELWQVEGNGAIFRAAAMFSAIIAAPLGEELVFRGIAQRLVHRLTGSPLLAVVIASVAFAAIHSPWTTQPSIFVLSLFLGWAYFRSGSILVPILMHSIFNLMQFAYFILLVLPGGSSAAH